MHKANGVEPFDNRVARSQPQHCPKIMEMSRAQSVPLCKISKVRALAGFTYCSGVPRDLRFRATARRVLATNTQRRSIVLSLVRVQFCDRTRL